MELDVIFISESWERENKTLEQIIELDDYTIVSNVFQRKGIGGRPAIIANNKKFQVQNITNTLVQIPWGVEAVWCILTPPNVTQDSKIKKIACCSFYSKPDSNRKSLLLDHISDAFSILSSKYGKGLHFILGADSNKLNLQSILNLSPNFVQIVTKFTRMNPPEMLDPIIMTLSSYYQEPEVLEPLDADPDKNGIPSDHFVVVAKPISSVNNKSCRQTEEIKTRPFPKSGMEIMKAWLRDKNWDEVYNKVSAHDKAKVFQSILVSKMDEIFPVKIRKINSDDQPWMTNKLKKLDRKRKRIYRKQRRSISWKQIDKKFKTEVKFAKNNFYKNKISELKLAKPGQWYKWLKKLSSHDQHHQVHVENLSHLSDMDQAEKIAEAFSSIPNEYEPLQSESIAIPKYEQKDIPVFHPSQVWFVFSRLETNKSNVPGDFPAFLIRSFAAYLAEPFTHILNSSIDRGEYPNIYKFEICTPVPKKFPPQSTKDLRNISGLKNFDKVMEKLISQLIISDMETSMDPAQYGNSQGISIQHYLIQMIHQILMAVDNNAKGEVCAVIANLIDWNNAFPRQCPKLGVESFIKNGVRPSLIPILINYFQDREMSVKWHGTTSAPKKINGGGPQGATLGILEYLSQSNNNADCVDIKDRFKFIDDLTTLEVVNLLITGVCSYNLKSQIPSDLPTHNQIIPSEQLNSQKWLNQINLWTTNQKMLLNEEKTKTMIFNFTNNHQFTTRLNVNNKNIEVVDNTKLLGTFITNDLRWDLNTNEIVKKANFRLQLMHKVSGFGASLNDMKEIYILFVRSILEQSSSVWHSSLTQENIDDLERVQKSALRIILKDKYKTYTNSLNFLQLDTLSNRRENLCLDFAKKCTKHPKLKHIFPLNNKNHQMDTRDQEKYFVQFANTERFQNSAIIYMQRLINEYENKISI